MELITIVRLLDKDRNVLGWNKIPCETRGDGCIWAKQAFTFEAESTGVGTLIHYHQADINVWLQLPLPNDFPVEVGKVFGIPLNGELFRFHSKVEDVPPAVTVRTPVTIAPGIARA
jgi:hypothetical protein